MRYTIPITVETERAEEDIAATIRDHVHALQLGDNGDPKDWGTFALVSGRPGRTGISFSPIEEDDVDELSAILSEAGFTACTATGWANTSGPQDPFVSVEFDDRPDVNVYMVDTGGRGWEADCYIGNPTDKDLEPVATVDSDSALIIWLAEYGNK